MALFEGEELIDVDVGGRLMRLPASVAAQLSLPPPPTQSVGINEQTIGGAIGNPTLPPPPPPPKKIGPIPGSEMETRAESTAQAPLPQDMPNSVLGPESPVNPDPNATSPSGGDYIAGSGPAVAKDMKARASEKASAPPSQKADPLAGGYGGAYEDQLRANRMQQETAINTADAQARGQEAAAGVLGDRNREIDKLFADREKQAQADLADIQKRVASYDAAAKKYADTKVDRKVDHPVMAAVGILMSAIGMGMMGKGDQENPAVKALYQAIDRKVAGQMADLEQKGKVLGFQKEAIENMRVQAKDQLAFKNLMIAGESERAARYMEELAAKTQSDVIRAQALEGAAGLRARAADLKMAAVDKQTDSNHKERDRSQRDMENKRNVGLGYANLKENRRQFDDTLKDKKEERDKQLAVAMMEADKAGDKVRAELFGKAAQENNEKGLGDKNGDYLLQPEGKKIFAEADKLEKKADEVAKKNPAAADTMRLKARQMRTEVLTDSANGVFRLPSGEAKMKFVEKISSMQKVNDLVKDIKDLYATEGKSFHKTTAGQQVISSKYVALLMAEKNIDQLGVLSKTDVALMVQKLGADPTKWDASQAASFLTDEIIGKDPDGFIKVLDGRVGDVKKDMSKQLRTAGFRGNPTELFDDSDNLPTETEAGKEYKNIYKDKSVNDQNTGASRDAYREADQGKLYSTSSVKQNVKDTGAVLKQFVQRGVFGGDDQNAIDNQSEFPGSALTKDAAASADRLIALAKTGNEDAKKLLLQGANNKNKPDHAGAIQHRLREQLPDLYNQTEAGKQRVPELPMIGGQVVPIENLASAATIDDASFKQLSRLAAKDAYAQKLLKGVIDYKTKQGR